MMLATRRNKCVHVVRVNVRHETAPAIADKPNDISFSSRTLARTVYRYQLRN